VSRRAAGLGLCALAAAVPLSAAGASLAPASPPSPRAGCEWHRHARRVVRHRRRGGGGHRQTRVRRWWTCDPPAPAATPEAPAAAAPQQPAPIEEATPPPASNLGVKAEEWDFTLSRPEVEAGEVVIELNNQGEDSHNLKIVREGGSEAPQAVPEAASGHQTSARVTLGPGTYRLYCSLPQHEQKGMRATLVVGEPTSP
jgi:plastocyanin